MHTIVLGARGHVGSSIVRLARDEGLQVTGLVRTRASAAALARRGVDAVVHDLARPLSREFWRSYDAFIHVAATNPTIDLQIAHAVCANLATGQRWIHTTGVWMYGSTPHLSASAPFNPPVVARWRVDVVDRLRTDTALDIRLIAPAVVHGGGRCASLDRLRVVTTDELGRPCLQTVGSGAQHWPTVHVTDLARLYLMACRSDGLPHEMIGASSERVTVADLSRLMSERAGYDGRIRFESGDEAVERLGAVGEAALLDQIAEPSMAAAIGWEPTGPSLAQEIRAGDFDWAVGSVRPFRRER